MSKFPETGFEIANVLVALGGDHGNTVPKYRVTAAEIAVLQSIHGADAVLEIHPIGFVPANHRVERDRLRQLYGRAKDGNNRSIVEMMFPGAAARVFERLDELQLQANQFKRGFVPEGFDEAQIDPQAEQDEEGQRYLAALEGRAEADAAGEPAELEADDAPLADPEPEPEPEPAPAPKKAAKPRKKAAAAAPAANALD